MIVEVLKSFKVTDGKVYIGGTTVEVDDFGALHPDIQRELGKKSGFFRIVAEAPVIEEPTQEVDSAEETSSEPQAEEPASEETLEKETPEEETEGEPPAEEPPKTLPRKEQ